MYVFATTYATAHTAQSIYLAEFSRNGKISCAERTQLCEGPRKPISDVNLLSIRSQSQQPVVLLLACSLARHRARYTVAICVISCSGGGVACWRVMMMSLFFCGLGARDIELYRSSEGSRIPSVRPFFHWARCRNFLLMPKPFFELFV